MSCCWLLAYKYNDKHDVRVTYPYYCCDCGCGCCSGPNITEEKAERARSLQMVLQQAEEERARRVADDAKGQLLLV